MRPCSRTPRPVHRKQIRHNFVAFTGIQTVWLLCGTVLTFLTAGCGGGDSASSPFGLEVVELKIGNQIVQAEVADTPEVSQRGLMFREAMLENHGMLFVFEAPRQASFYMKNTKLPLTIAYITGDGLIAEIYDLEPLDITPVKSRSQRIEYALEMNQGWFRKHGIEPGTSIEGLPPRR